MFFACSEGLWFLRCILLRFEVVSSLQINLAKNELIPLCCREHRCFGCKYGFSSTLPSYLGLPLEEPFKAKAVWGLVVERFRRG